MTVPSVPPPPTPSTAKTTGSTSTAAPRLKLVIRRLPPTLPEEIFWKSVGPWLGDVSKLTSGESKISWKRYVAGKPVSDTNQHRVFSRAYVQMKTAEDLAEFAHAYDGHGFRGKDGQEFQAVVEFAPAQKIPSSKSKPRVDARQGTIDNGKSVKLLDVDFLSFLESLKAPVVKQDINAVEAHPEQPKSTPLLDHLRETRLGKKSSSSGARSSTPDQGKGGRNRDPNNSIKDKGKGSGKSNNKSGEKDSAGKNVKGDKKDTGKSGTNGKKDQVQGLSANRENVKIQMNPARQQGGAAGNAKVQILQRGPGGTPSAGPSNANAQQKPNKQAPPVPRSKDGDDTSPKPKPKPNPTARQRPERGPKSLLSAALNASAQQAGGKKPVAVAANPAAGTGDKSEPTSTDEADKKKRPRTRGGRGGTGKKKAGEGEADGTGVANDGERAGGSGANPARIDD